MAESDMAESDMAEEPQTKADADALRIWVVTDGRAGNVNPSLGLAEALSRRFPAQIAEKTLKPRGSLARLPPVVVENLSALLGQRSEGWPFRAFDDGPNLFAPPYPGLVIGCGRLGAPVVSAIGFLSGRQTRTVQLLNPQLPLKRFDLVIAPKHDRLRAENLLETVGSLTRDRSAEAPSPDPRLAAAPRPLLTVLIGGVSRSAGFDMRDAAALVAGLEPFFEQGWGVAATLSNRTPEDVATRLRAEIAERGGWLWNGEGSNPYAALLAEASAIVATADSVNMASEACATGKPVFIAPLNKLSPKLERFHAALRAGGHAKPLAEAPAEGWRPTPLDDMPRAVDAVAALLRL